MRLTQAGLWDRFCRDGSLYCWAQSAPGCISHVWTQDLLLHMNTCHGFTCPPRFQNPLGPSRDAEKALVEVVRDLRKH